MRISTKQTILQAFNDLLMENPFDKITIEMIAKRSNISKATFYRYFMDKYDVMNYSYRLLVESAFLDPKCNSWRSLFVALAERGRSDSSRLRKAYNSQGVNSYTTYAFSFTYDVIEQVIFISRGTNSLAEEEICKLTHFCYGVVGLFYNWINGDFSCSTETFGQFIYDIMPEEFRDTWIDTQKAADIIAHSAEIASHPTKGFSIV